MTRILTPDGLVVGTSGNDSIGPGFVDANGDKIDGNDAILAGTVGNDDVIIAGPGNDYINAGDGNDLIYAGAGSDTVLGNGGQDTIYGDSSPNDVVVPAGDGHDTCAPGATVYNDLLYGGDGNDVIYGEISNDTLFGDAGNDILFGGVGNDSLSGGENDDQLSGGDDNDTLQGDNGNDTLSGGTGTNILYGGNGDDLFIGGAGADKFYGGTGQDNIDYSNSQGPVTVDLSNSSLAGGDAGNDTIGNGIDGVYGSTFNDSLTGFNQQGTGPADTFTNQFWGNGGDDTISGLGGNDELHGGNDNDQLFGGSGDDQVYGDAGDDSLVGGDGIDNLFGGSDNDIMHVNLGGSADGGSTGTDFDTLDLRGLVPAGGSYVIVNESIDPDGDSTSGEVVFRDTNGAEVGRIKFNEIEKIIPCFTPGTLVATPRGEVPVERLREGDKIVTRDNGIQEIRWVGRKDLAWQDLAANPHLRPVLIRQGSLGNGLPERDMMVSPNHRMLVANDRTALYFDEHEVLVAAKHLVAGRGIDLVEAASTSYIHFMFDRHEVVLANGAWTESFQPGDYSLKGLGNAQRNEIFDLFPELKSADGLQNFAAARKVLKKHEAMLIAR